MTGEEFEQAFHRCVRASLKEREEILCQLPGGPQEQMRRLLASDSELSTSDGDEFLLNKSLLAAASVSFDCSTIDQGSTNDDSSRETDLEERKAIGPYQILNVIAVHGQGVVYRADHPHLNRQVVIKVSKHQIDDARQNMLLKEGQALASLSHPNLAQVYDLQFDDGRPYLVMEYIEGRNLADRLKVTKLEPEEAVRLTVKVARAVQHAHELGVIHRDLKPANVVIRASDGMPKVIDLGLATTKSAFGEDSLSSSYGGTISYMAPEQALGFLGQLDDEQKGDERIDVFAIGAMLYEMLTGERLYRFESKEEGLRMASAGKFYRTKLDQPGISNSLRQICLKALETEPGNRWRTADELAVALDDAIAPSKVSGRLRQVAFAVLTFAMTGLVAFLLWQSISESRSGAKNETGTSKVTDQNIGPSFFGLEMTGFTHFVHEEGADVPSPLFSNRSVREDDGLRIELRFKEPVYAFLFAINPDGNLQLCFPEEEPYQVQGSPIRSLTYPEDQAEGFAFTDGSGQQTFVIVTSTTPLPSFSAWQNSAGELARLAEQIKGKWLWEDGKADIWRRRGETRGKRKLAGADEVTQLFEYLESIAPEQQVFGLSFPVIER